MTTCSTCCDYLRDAQVQNVQQDIVDDCIADVGNQSSYNLRPYDSLEKHITARC